MSGSLKNNLSSHRRDFASEPENLRGKFTYSKFLSANRWASQKGGGCLMRLYIKKFLSNEDGATAIEYGLIASLIAVVIIGAVSVVGTKLTATFNEVASNLN